MDNTILKIPFKYAHNYNGKLLPTLDFPFSAFVMTPFQVFFTFALEARLDKEFKERISNRNVSCSISQVCCGLTLEPQ